MAPSTESIEDCRPAFPIRLWAEAGQHAHWHEQPVLVSQGCSAAWDRPVCRSRLALCTEAVGCAPALPLRLWAEVGQHARWQRLSCSNVAGAVRGHWRWLRGLWCGNVGGWRNFFEGA